MRRSVPLVLVASTSSATADGIAAQLRREGNVVYVARTVDGALRVATSVGPDLVLLDPALPPRLEQLLRAHPMLAESRILHLSSTVPRAPRREQPAAVTAGPHAA
jgi:DNA-binding response OmpR family regulator